MFGRRHRESLGKKLFGNVGRRIIEKSVSKIDPFAIFAAVLFRLVSPVGRLHRYDTALMPGRCACPFTAYAPLGGTRTRPAGATDSA